MATGLRMNVILTPRHKRYVAAKVKSGAYGSPEEVIREELRLPEAQDERQHRLKWLEGEVEKGFAGPMTPWTRRDSDRVRRLITKRGLRNR